MPASAFTNSNWQYFWNVCSMFMDRLALVVVSWYELLFPSVCICLPPSLSPQTQNVMTLIHHSPAERSRALAYCGWADGGGEKITFLSERRELINIAIFNCTICVPFVLSLWAPTVRWQRDVRASSPRFLLSMRAIGWMQFTVCEAKASTKAHKEEDECMKGLLCV